MTDKLKQIIEREVGKLPKEDREIISTFGWEKISEEIGTRYLINEGEVNDFQVQILLVLVGIEDASLFALHIENEIGTSKKEAEKISDEVFEKIFIPIAEKLEENLKKSDKVKNANWQQNLDFVLSGGDYSSFVDIKDVSLSSDSILKTKAPIASEKTDDVKLKLVI
ncbi:MAG: hypothetical protein WCT44_00755 [Candidatus Paceibacterota bacterium]